MNNTEGLPNPPALDIENLSPRTWIQVTHFQWYDFVIISLGTIMLIASIILVNFVHIGGFWVPLFIIPG